MKAGSGSWLETLLGLPGMKDRSFCKTPMISGWWVFRKALLWLCIVPVRGYANPRCGKKVVKREGWKTMRYGWAVLMICLTSAVALAESALPYQVAGPVEVLAGDVLDIEDVRPYRDVRFPSRLRVHLQGIDAPEPSQSCMVEENKRWFCGTAAEQALSRSIGKQDVVCRNLRKGVGEKIFGDCFVGEVNLAEWLVSAGFALADPETGESFRSLEAEAKKEKKGIWNSRFDLPWVFRAQTEEAMMRFVKPSEGSPTP